MNPPMRSPGEQTRTPPVSLRRVLIALLVCAVLAAVLFTQRRNLNEYRLYLTEDRKAASIDLTALSEDWSETRLREHFMDIPVNCYPYRGPLAVQRACAVDVASVNGVPAMYMSFFFAGGRLDQLSISVPWWSHGAAHENLFTLLGEPTASQLLPHEGVRLHGWKLGNGAAMFLNRDRPLNPFWWNGIHWRSATACKRDGCFHG